MSLNGISTEVAGNGSDPIATKQKRRVDKLALASAKRAASSTSGYRKLNKIVGSHTAYVGTSTTVVSGTASPVPGHPWSA